MVVKEPEQVPVDGTIITYEFLEGGAKLVVIVEGMTEIIPRKVKIIW